MNWKKEEVILMKKSVSYEYGINLEYEIRTYKNIGRDYGNRKTLNRGLINNIRRYIRKKCLNPTEKRYKFCNTYSDWVEHVKGIIPMEICNADDFLRYLIFKKRNEEFSLETVKIILIPIYLVMIQLKDVFNIENAWMALIVMVIIAIVSCCVMLTSTQKLEFYQDLIEVVEAELNINSEQYTNK